MLETMSEYAQVQECAQYRRLVRDICDNPGTLHENNVKMGRHLRNCNRKSCEKELDVWESDQYLKWFLV